MRNSRTTSVELALSSVGIVELESDKRRFYKEIFFLTNDQQSQWRSGNLRNRRAWAKGCAAETHHRARGASQAFCGLDHINLPAPPVPNALLASRLRQTRRHRRITTQLAHYDAIGALRRTWCITTQLAHYDAIGTLRRPLLRPCRGVSPRPEGRHAKPRTLRSHPRVAREQYHHDFKRAPLATGWRPDLSLV